MAKELPYFKFYVNDWINGDITLETYELQGLFINVCGYYWSKDCELSLNNLLKKFREVKADIQILIDCGVIKIDNGIVRISFLNEQLQSKEVQIITNRRNGSLGGRPRKEETKEKPNGLNFDNRNESESITETKANDNPNITNIKESKEDNTNSILLSAKADQTKNFLDRKEKFKQSIAVHVELYGKETCNEFFKYWTEPNKSKTKMAFEIQKTWDVSRRLERWARNDFNSKSKQIPKGYSPQITN